MSSRSLPGPIHAIPVDDDREKLRKQNEKLTRENEDLKLANQRVQMENRRIMAAAANLKQWTDPLFKSLKMLNGEFDSMDLPEPETAGAAPRQAHPSDSNSNRNPKFANALARLDGPKAEVLKLILDVGPQTIRGMVTALRIGQQTAYDATSYLGRMGLIKRGEGKRFELKED